MKFRLVDEDGDWLFGSGVQSYSKDLQAVMLNVKTRILSWVRDCFFDLEAGIDWKNLLDYGMKDRLLSAIKMAAFKAEGVLRVNDLEIDITGNRTANISMSLDTIYGSEVQSVINVAA
jgi:hypothetical protein